MKDSEVYREAAKIMSELRDDPEDGMCYALCLADHAAAMTELTYLMGPPGNKRAYWGNDWGRRYRHACRVLALCFMAAIAESEGR